MDISRLNGAPEPPIQLPPTYSKPTGRRTMKRDLTDADVNQQMMLLDHLPPCTGPKLHAFRYRNENIQWIVRLDDPRKPQGLDQGHVFEVVIQNQRYALKLFKFIQPGAAGESKLTSNELDSISDEELAFHTDPFFAECRAYARIQDFHIASKKVSAECYGFLALSQVGMAEILDAHGIDLWSNVDPDDDYRFVGKDMPIRALVKEYIRPAAGDGAVTPSTSECKHMLQTVRLLGSMKILHGKMHLNAFHPHSGLLISFSASWTLNPHVVMDVTKSYVAEAWRTIDLVMFDDIMDGLGKCDKVRALPHFRYLKKLRSRGKWADQEWNNYMGDPNKEK